MAQEIIYLTQVRDLSNTTLDILLANLTSAANGGYSQANTATQIAGGAFAQANNAFARANGALTEATSAYTLAQSAVTQIAQVSTTASAALTAAGNAQTTANEGIAPSGVGAGSYGSSVSIPTFTVDARGRITAVNPVAPALFTATAAGVVKASGGGTTNFLRADGAFASVLNTVVSSTSLSNPGSIVINGIIINFGNVSCQNGFNNLTFKTPVTNMATIVFECSPSYFEVYPSSGQTGSIYRTSGSSITGINFAAGAAGTAFYISIGYN